MNRYILKHIEGSEDPFDVELNGYKTKIRKVHLADRDISIPESFVCIISNFSTKNTPLICNDCIPVDYIYDLLKNHKRFEMIFVNTNPKIACGKKLLEKDIQDPKRRSFSNVIFKEDKYDDFITGICSSVYLYINKEGKIDRYSIEYVENLGKKLKEYSNTIYVDWRWHPERYE